MPSIYRAPMKPGAIQEVLATDLVSGATRRALEARMDWTPTAELRCFDLGGFATLKAVGARLIPQSEKEDRRVNLAARFDARLAEGPGDGWRYDALPPDRQAMKRGIAGIERTAQARFGGAFEALDVERQDDILCAVQAGEADSADFEGLNQGRFFEELLAALTELYFSHPQAFERIGFVGMADAYGFHALGLEARDPIEDEASLAPL